MTLRRSLEDGGGGVAGVVSRHELIITIARRKRGKFFMLP